MCKLRWEPSHPTCKLNIASHRWDPRWNSHERESDKTGRLDLYSTFVCVGDQAWVKVGPHTAGMGVGIDIRPARMHLLPVMKQSFNG